MAMAMPPSDMMLELTPISFMVMKAISTEIGRVSTITRALWKWSRKIRITSETTTDSSSRFCLQGIDGPLDQVGAVVGDHDLHAWRQPFFQLLDLDLDPVDDILGVFAVAHDHDAADRLTFAVHLQQTAPDGATHLHRAQILDVDRRAAHVGADNDIFQVCLRLDIAATTDQVFGVSLFDQSAPHILVGCLDRIHDLGDLDVVGKQFGRVQVDLVFPHQSADGGDFGHPLDGVELVAHEPVLQGAQLLQVIPLPLDGVPEDMADAGAVRTKSRDHAGRQQ